MTDPSKITDHQFIWKLKAGANSVRADLITLSDFELIGLDTLQQLEPLVPLTKMGELLRSEFPDEPELWEGRISRSKKRKPRPVDAWLFMIGDSEYQTIPTPPIDPKTGRLIEEHELGEYPPELAEKGRFFYEVRKPCQLLERGRIPLTYQLRMRRPTLATPDAPVEVFSHPQLKQLFSGVYPSIPYPKKCFLSDYLEDLWKRPVRFVEESVKSEFYRSVRGKRRLTVSLEAFFALADFYDFLPYPMVMDYLEQEMLDGSIEHGRRLKICKVIKQKKVAGSASKAEEPFPSELLDLPLIAVIDGKSYAIRLHILDPSAQLGQSGGSLVKYHACAGIAMDAKDAFSSEDKSRMIYQWARAACHEEVMRGKFGNLIRTDSHGYLSACSIYRTDPEAFVSYSAGDVKTLDAAIIGVEEMFRTDLYGALGWADYYQKIKMTAGASILDFVKAGFLKSMEPAMGLIPNPEGFLRSLGCSEKAAYMYAAEWSVSGVLPARVIKWLLDVSFTRASSAEIAKENSLMASNAKVVGGRCINLSPNILSAKGVLTDMDLASAYTKSCTAQEMPFGRPNFIGAGFDRDTHKNNGYSTLRQFLAKHGEDLVPGLYQVWITCPNLPSDQDFFPTWDKPKAFTDFDTEDVSVWLDRSDLVKHFLNEFTDSPYTHDVAQWLRKVASEELREWIMDHAIVTAAAFYQKRYRCASTAEYVKQVYDWEMSGKAKHTSEVNGAVETSEKRYCPFWFSVNLGELVINKFDSERQVHKKVTNAYKVLTDRKVKVAADLKSLAKADRELITSVLNGREGQAGYQGGLDKLIADSKSFDKYPLDELFKLAANTTYGVMVSRFFLLSNPIVGNGITARVRAMIWYFEKACGSSMSITDGGVFDVNRVVYPRKPDRKLTEKALTLLHQKTKTELHTLYVARRPIGDFKEIRWESDGGLTFEHADPDKTRCFGPQQITGPDSASVFIDELTMAHTRLVFAHAVDEIDVLNPETCPFKFEAKGIVAEFALQGQSNYMLRGGSHGGYKDGKPKEVVAMRGIKKDLHPTHVAPFLSQLIDNPTSIVRGDHARVYLQGMILKTGEFCERFFSFYSDTFLLPGDSYYKAGLMREFSVSGFRYRTMRQMKLWDSRHQKLRDFRVEPSIVEGQMNIRGGQSFEAFHITKNKGGQEVLNLAKLVNDASKRILQGLGPWQEDPELDHPRVEDLAVTKFRLKALVAKKSKPSFIATDKMMKEYEVLLADKYEENREELLLANYEQEVNMDDYYC